MNITIVNVKNPAANVFELWGDYKTSPAHTVAYIHDGKKVDSAELEFRYGVANFSTARQFFEHFDEIKAQKDADYERDLEIEMATTF